MADVADYLDRAAKRSGFRRESFLQKNMPTEPSNVLAVPFYGDLRSSFVMSSLLLNNYKAKNRDKYVVVCSWPGMHGLFPYADEYWSIEDDSATKTLALSADNLYNHSDLAAEITRGLFEVLSVATAKDFAALYGRGLTPKFWSDFPEPKLQLVDLPSASKFTEEFKSQMSRLPGPKVVVYPAARMRSWQQGRSVYLPVGRDFWHAMIERLLAAGYSPVVYQNHFTHDVSREFADRCAYLATRGYADTLAAFRHVGCVLDVHTGVSRLALAARCPFLCVTERQMFVGDRDYEIDDICGGGVPRRYVYSFSTMLMAGGAEDWKVSVLDNVVKELGTILSGVATAKLPTTVGSSTAVSRSAVRERRAKRLGAAFLKPGKK